MADVPAVPSILSRIRAQKPLTTTPSTEPMAQSFSNTFAAAVEQAKMLETELAAATTRAIAQQARAEKAEEQLNDSQLRCEKLQSERDDAKSQLDAVEAKLQASATIILDCLRKKPVVENYRPKSEGVRAVARALAGEEQDARPIPGFLQKPQEDDSEPRS